MFDGAYLFAVGFCFAITISALLFALYLFNKDILKTKSSTGFSTRGLIKEYFTHSRIRNISITIIVVILIITGFHIYDKINTIVLKARFRDVGMLSKGSDVIYRGVNIGEVTNITLTKDSEYAIVHFKIPVNSPGIYKDSTAEISFRSITGAQALVIKPPRTLKGKKALIHGDIIEGKDSITVEETQKLIAKMIEEGKLELMINNFSQLLTNTNDIVAGLNKLNEGNQQDLKDFLKSSTALSTSLKHTSDSVNQLLAKTNASNEIETLKDIKNLVIQTSELVKQTNNLVLNSNNLVSNVDTTVNNAESTGNLRSSIQKLDNILTDVQEISGDQKTREELKQSIKNVSVVISDIKDITADAEVKKNLKKTIIGSGESITRINCFSKKLGNTLSKRFLLPRLLIGKPAENINSCFQEEVIEK